jgi:hypothetical protein
MGNSHSSLVGWGGGALLISGPDRILAKHSSVVQSYFISMSYSLRLCLALYPLFRLRSPAFHFRVESPALTKR